MATTSESPATLINNTDKTDNPLRKYRSYSYQFFLVAADNTQIFQNILTNAQNVNVQNTSATPNDPNSTKFFERPTTGNPRGAISTSYGSYSIVIDTRMDTDYIIQDVEWGTTFVGNSNDSDSPVALNTVLTDGKMTIVEPRGVNFLNTLADLADTLKVDPSVMPFMLKVIFIGHNDDGSVDQITDIPPFGIFFTGITGSVDSNGATYHMKYVGAVNGFSDQQVFDSITDGVGFVFSNKVSLEDHLKRFETLIQYHFDRDRDRILKNYKYAGFDLSHTAKLRWKFVLEDNSDILQHLTDFSTVNPAHVSGGDSSTPYTGTKDGGVHELLNKLFSSSRTWTTKQISDSPSAGEFDKQKIKYSWKVNSEITKTSSTAGDNSITITYYISEYSYRVVPVTPTGIGSGNAIPVVIPQDQLYTFDYLFTGRNIDIIKLDMNMSLAFAQWFQLSTTRSLPTQTDDTTGTVVQSATVSLYPPTGFTNPNKVIRAGTPIMPAAISKDTYMKEYIPSAQSAAADAIWRNFALAQAIKAELIIHGNPNLIQKISVPSRSSPDYVKINIKKPNTSDDIWEYNQQDNSTPGGYYSTFWFDGFYNIITAKNKFIGGQFTQELYLVAIPEISSDMEQIRPAQNDEDNQNQQPNSTFGPRVSPPIGLPGFNITPPLTNPSTLSKPTNTSAPPSTHQAFVARYYNNALAASQRASSQYGTPAINPDYILSQAALESGWGTSTGASQYNNFFGVKSSPGSPNEWWDGTTIPLRTQEQNSTGTPYTIIDNFRVYDSATSGFGDHARLITQRYGDADSATSIGDYVTALQNKPGGGSYATDVAYGTKLAGVYAQIQTIKASLGIVGTNTPYAGADFSQAYGGPAPDPFLPQPSNGIAANTGLPGVTYSATDRSVTDAAQTQKTLLYLYNQAIR